MIKTYLLDNNTFVGFRLTQTAAFTPIEAWHRIPQPNIIRVREAFTTRAFGDNCTCSFMVIFPG